MIERFSACLALICLKCAKFFRALGIPGWRLFLSIGDWLYYCYHDRPDKNKDM